MAPHCCLPNLAASSAKLLLPIRGLIGEQGYQGAFGSISQVGAWLMSERDVILPKKAVTTIRLAVELFQQCWLSGLRPTNEKAPQGQQQMSIGGLEHHNRVMWYRDLDVKKYLGT
ncbi:uncharacterized [Tachysurus ichikawai]